MVSVKVKLVGTTQKLGKQSFHVVFDEPVTIMGLVKELILNSSLNYIIDVDEENMTPKSNILILVDGKDISVLDGLNTILKDGESVTFIPVSHGG